MEESLFLQLTAMLQTASHFSRILHNVTEVSVAHFRKLFPYITFYTVWFPFLGTVTTSVVSRLRKKVSPVQSHSLPILQSVCPSKCCFPYWNINLWSKYVNFIHTYFVSEIRTEDSEVIQSDMLHATGLLWRNETHSRH